MNFFLSRIIGELRISTSEIEMKTKPIFFFFVNESLTGLEEKFLTKPEIPVDRETQFRNYFFTFYKCRLRSHRKLVAKPSVHIKIFIKALNLKSI